MCVTVPLQRVVLCDALVSGITWLSPKSETRARKPRSSLRLERSRIFLGFRSRCVTRSACRYSMAAATSASVIVTMPMSTPPARVALLKKFCSIASCRLPQSQYSMMMCVSWTTRLCSMRHLDCGPPRLTSRKSYACTTFGCLSVVDIAPSSSAARWLDMSPAVPPLPPPPHPLPPRSQPSMSCPCSSTLTATRRPRQKALYTAP
mmetsp:Transcript_8525/g.25821  ORF Transcript_8525/g.25821 Transcript_8525/m.25821 type:complete len:205 (-) Transcript_8525:355-969(-)